MSFFAYIVCWDEVYENVVDIETQFVANSVQHKIINSGIRSKSHWLNVGDIRYYRQFIKAVEDFDDRYEYMLFLCGDVSYNKWQEFITRSYYVLNNYNVGLYAPHLTNEPWTENASKISDIDLDQNLTIAIQTDGIAVFIKRDIVKMLKEFFVYLQSEVNIGTMTSGWGLDLSWCAYAIYNDMLIFRDKANILNHPPGSSYNHGKASEECAIVLSKFYEFCKIKGLDPKKMSFIKDKIYGRMSHAADCLGVYDFYQKIDIKKNKNKINYHIISINDERKENKDLIDQVFSNERKLRIKSLDAKNENSLKEFYKNNPEFKFNKEMWPNYKPGELGNFGSHFQAWKYLVNSDLTNLIVFEDDSIIDRDFIESYINLMNFVPEDYDVFSIYIDENQYPRYNAKDRVNEFISLGYQDWSTLCYVISKNGAKKLYDHVVKEGMYRPTDWFIFRGGHEGKFKVYSLNPNIKVSVSIDKRYQSQVQ